MDNFDWRKMSKIVYPNGINETQYLRYGADGKWTASDKDQCCVLSNCNPAGNVAVLNAKMHPINDEDRRHMIASMEAEIQSLREFIDKYGSYPKWKSEIKDANRGIARLEKEIHRLRELSFPQALPTPEERGEQEIT